MLEFNPIGFPKEANSSNEAMATALLNYVLAEPWVDITFHFSDNSFLSIFNPRELLETTGGLVYYGVDGELHKNESAYVLAKVHVYYLHWLF